MGYFKRSVFSNIHHKQRFLLMFMIVLIASILLQVTYQIRLTASESVEEIRKNIGASVNAHLELLGPGLSGWNKYESEYFSYDIAEEIARLPEVKQSNYFCMVNVSSKEIDGCKTGIMDEDQFERDYPGVGDFQLVGVSDMQSFWNFEKGIDHLVEGRFIAPDDTEMVAVVSQRLMYLNFLNLGDTITVSSYFDKNQSVELKIVGFHSGDDMNLVPEFKCNINYIYTPLDVAIQLNGGKGVMEAEYELNDPAQLESFLSQAHSISEKYNIDLEFIENNMDFIMASTALNGLIKTCDAIFLTVIALFSIILSLLVIYLMNDRFFEIGILLSLGEKKIKIVFQMILEVLMPTILAINIGVLISSFIIPVIGKAIATGMQINQPLTSTNIAALFLLVNCCGILLVIIASIIPTIAIRKYTPKQILQNFK